MLTYTKGSYYATIEMSLAAIGEDVEYIVIRTDGSRETVPRRQLRQRVWHRVAFLGVTNEKQHVALTTQAFHNEELEFWRHWHESGQDAALAYAAADRASIPSLVPAAATDQAKARAQATRTTRKAAAAAAAAPIGPTGAPNPALPTCAVAASSRSLAATKPGLAPQLAKLDGERFKALVAHSDNATHLKSSGNLHYWSHKLDELKLPWPISLNPSRSSMAARVRVRVRGTASVPRSRPRCATTSSTRSCARQRRRRAGESPTRLRWRSTCAVSFRRPSGSTTMRI